MACLLSSDDFHMLMILSVLLFKKYEFNSATYFSIKLKHYLSCWNGNKPPKLSWLLEGIHYIFSYKTNYPIIFSSKLIFYLHYFYMAVTTLIFVIFILTFGQLLKNKKLSGIPVLGKKSPFLPNGSRMAFFYIIWSLFKYLFNFVRHFAAVCHWYLPYLPKSQWHCTFLGSILIEIHCEILHYKVTFPAIFIF